MYPTTTDHVKAYELLLRQRRTASRRRTAADAGIVSTTPHQALRVLHVRAA